MLLRSSILICRRQPGDGPGSMSGLRRCQLSQPLHVPYRWLAEVALIFAAEMGLVVVADAVSGFAGIEVLAEHQPPRFLEAQVLLELQWAHCGHRLEVGVEAGHAHTQLR